MVRLKKIFGTNDGSNCGIMLGSHHSFTYLPIRAKVVNGKFVKPDEYLFRCQSLTVEKQYECGVRVFDLHIRMKGGNAVICNGECDFIGNPLAHMRRINVKGVKCIIVNEDGLNEFEFERYVFGTLVPSCRNIEFCVFSGSDMNEIVYSAGFGNVRYSYFTNDMIYGYLDGKYHYRGTNQKYSAYPERWSMKYNNMIYEDMMRGLSLWYDILGYNSDSDSECGFMNGVTDDYDRILDMTGGVNTTSYDVMLTKIQSHSFSYVSDESESESESESENVVKGVDSDSDVSVGDSGHGHYVLNTETVDVNGCVNNFEMGNLECVVWWFDFVGKYGCKGMPDTSAVV